MPNVTDMWVSALSPALDMQGNHVTSAYSDLTHVKIQNASNLLEGLPASCGDRWLQAETNKAATKDPKNCIKADVKNGIEIESAINDLRHCPPARTFMPGRASPDGTNTELYRSFSSAPGTFPKPDT